MTRKIIIQRKRIYLAVEGESEQSFIKFLQQISDQNNIHVHLDCEVLGGGGYKTMLEKAISYRSRREKNKGSAKISILIVDTDRADKNEDGWSLEQLTLEANKYHFDVCLQKPNLEGLLLRMFSGYEHTYANASSARKERARNNSRNWHLPINAILMRSSFSNARNTIKYSFTLLQSERINLALI